MTWASRWDAYLQQPQNGQKVLLRSDIRSSSVWVQIFRTDYIKLYQHNFSSKSDSKYLRSATHGIVDTSWKFLVVSVEPGTLVFDCELLMRDPLPYRTRRDDSPQDVAQ